MEEQVKELDRLIKKEAEGKVIYNAFYEEFLNNTKSITESLNQVKDLITHQKQIVSTSAIEEFKKTGSKKLYGDIGIQERSSLIYDEKQAFNFAKEKDMFLQLDKKAFEKVAESLNLDFVKSEKNIIATFPKEIKINE